MARVVLIIACLCVVLSVGVLPHNLHHPAVLVVNVLGLAVSAMLAALAWWKLRAQHRDSSTKD